MCGARLRRWLAGLAPSSATLSTPSPSSSVRALRQPRRVLRQHGHARFGTPAGSTHVRRHDGFRWSLLGITQLRHDRGIRAAAHVMVTVAFTSAREPILPISSNARKPPPPALHARHGRVPAIEIVASANLPHSYLLRPSRPPGEHMSRIQKRRPGRARWPDQVPGASRCSFTSSAARGGTEAHEQDEHLLSAFPGLPSRPIDARIRGRAGSRPRVWTGFHASTGLDVYMNGATAAAPERGQIQTRQSLALPRSESRRHPVKFSRSGCTSASPSRAATTSSTS